MGRDQNTVAKRLREIAKKRKAEEKRIHRRKKKERAAMPVPLNSEQSSDSEQPTKNFF